LCQYLKGTRLRKEGGDRQERRNQAQSVLRELIGEVAEEEKNAGIKGRCDGKGTREGKPQRLRLWDGMVQTRGH